MSDPADKNFDNPADNPYAPKSVRPANPEGGPGAAEIAFPRFMRSANQQGSPGAENEIPRERLRPSSERDAKLWRKSLEPKIIHSGPPPPPLPWCLGPQSGCTSLTELHGGSHLGLVRQRPRLLRGLMRQKHRHK
jgi:hypothetical protein